VRLAGQRLDAGHRADGDHRSATVLVDQHRRGGLERAPHAREVDVDQPLPLLVGHLPEPAPVGDAGVGHDDVEPAERGDAIGHQRVELLLLAHVGDPGDDLATGALDPGDRLAHVLAAEITRDDVVAVVGERDADGAAETLRGAGDERGHAVSRTAADPLSTGTPSWLVVVMRTSATSPSTEVTSPDAVSVSPGHTWAWKRTP